jgi:hypothetical protein
VPHPNQATAETLHNVSRTQNALEAELDRRQGAAPSLHDQRAIEATAKRFAPLFSDLNLTPPQPRGDESPLAFQIRNLKSLRQWSSWKDADTRTFASFAESGALPTVEAEIMQTARARADDRTLGRVGAVHELRTVKRVDEHGNTVITHHGDPLSWMQTWMPSVVSCVKAFGDGKGRWFPEERN